MSKIATLALLILSATAAHAENFCVVDPETQELRDHLLATDNDYLVPDETGEKLEWVVNDDPLIDHDQMYSKSGEAQAIPIAKLVQYGWVSGAPLLKAVGDPEVPDVIYLLANPKGCLFQAYQKAPY
ncbi:MAG TPA: hypothetical protein VHA70_09350 [Bauldia sp.]|nr:hypothetical protein [Bauldia sp.]